MIFEVVHQSKDLWDGIVNLGGDEVYLWALEGVIDNLEGRDAGVHYLRGRKMWQLKVGCQCQG